MITKRGKTPSSLDKHVRGRTTASACDLKGTAKGDYSGLISGDSFRISDLFVSSNTTENIKCAMKYRRDDELVQQIVNTKLDFLVAGFRNHCTNADALGFYNQLCLEHEFDSIITELADDMLTTDNAILHWKVDDGGKIEYIMTLNPSFVKYSNAMGQEKLELVLDEDMRKSLVEIKKSQNLSIPKKYDGSSTTVELRNADGEYWQVLSVGGRRFTSLVKPSMAAVFADLRLRNLFVDGDWSTAFFAKAFIQLIKSGESIDSGPLAGSKRNWQTKKENTELNNLFRDVSRALRVVGNHTLTVEHIVPPKEAYAEERYTPVETRIFRWGGMPKVVIEGSGGQYASGFIGKTKLIADIRRKRMILARFLEKFYRHPTINGGQFDDTPKVRFNEQVLKDPKELQDEVKLLLTFATGFSAQSALEAFGYEAVTEWARKTEELDPEMYEVLLPIFEPSQGLTGGDGAGRPEGDADTPQTPASKGRKGRTNADYSTKSYYHIDVPGVDGDIVATKKLSNGIALRLVKRESGETKAKVIFVPKSMFKTLKKAKEYVGKNFAEGEYVEDTDE